MVQTRGQQTGEQSPSGRGALRGITAEGDTASTAVTLGNTPKHAVSAEHSAAILADGDSGRDEPVAPHGAGSPTTIGVSIPMGTRAHPSGVVLQAGNGAQMTDSQGVTKGCSGIDEAVGGLANGPPQCAAAQKPDQSTNYIRGSEQWSCDYCGISASLLSA